MPQVFKVGQYVVYFWSSEGVPLEPVHVHIAINHPRPNGTKVWITSTGKALLCNNAADIPFVDLRKLLRVIEANSDEIIEQWQQYFETTQFYC